MNGRAFVGKPSPFWKAAAVIDGDIEQLSSDQYLGRYLVLFFYPMDFTFVCPTEILAFSERVEEFRGVNCEVLGCSTDTEYCHLAWTHTPIKKGGIGPVNIALVADVTKQIARDYGVLNEETGVALRGLFITDSSGTLRYISVHDLGVGRSVDETLRVVQAIQFSDIHGEDGCCLIRTTGCPANWNPETSSTTGTIQGSNHVSHPTQSTHNQSQSPPKA